jgi:hypothetical protein
MQKPWSGIFSFFLFCLLAFQVEALPKNKGTTNTNTGTKAAAAAAAAGSTTITKATDGSTIMDKTVQIK